MRAPFTAISLLILAGCSSGKPGADTTPAPSAQASASASEALANASPAPPAPPAPDKAAARSVKVDNDLYSFEYSYPTAAAAIPDLKAWLDADLEKTKADLASEAREARADAKKEGFPYNPYDTGEEWQVVADLPGWLSLSGNIYAYTGGAHGNSAFETVLWNKQAGVRRQPLDLFTSAKALGAAIRKPFCAGLDKERAKKREGTDMDNGITEFSECIDPMEQTVILGSSNGATFDRIGLLIAPYAAGPYAEGSYEVTVPVTGAVLAAVKPEYRSSFAVKR